MKKSSITWKKILILLFGLGIVAGFLYRKNISGSTPTSIINPLSNNPIAMPQASPFLFQELTIPYLRSRSYVSNLGELEKIGENAGYISYLASYDSDGLNINGLLTIPKGRPSTRLQLPSQSEGGQASSGQNTKWPAIIFLHGYIPPQNYRTTVNYSSNVDYLARNGFVVFKIDLRGHDRSEGEASGAYYSADYIIDTLNARAALANSDFVNPQAIGLWGHSMAGNIVFRSFVSQNIPAVVIWAGAVYNYTDFQQYSIEDGSYQPPPQDSERARKRRELFEKYGQFNADSDFWKQVVPTNYLDGVTGAVLINHATNDNVVSIEYSRNLMSLLEGTKIDHELVEYSSGGHNLTGSTFSQAMEKTVQFFQNHLK